MVCIRAACARIYAESFSATALRLCFIRQYKLSSKSFSPDSTTTERKERFFKACALSSISFINSSSAVS